MKDQGVVLPSWVVGSFQNTLSDTSVNRAKINN
jgi:hypothetical protein